MFALPLATTADLVIPAAFGVAGTIIGALIARAGELSQRRSDRYDQVLIVAEEFAFALEDLRANPTVETVRLIRRAMRRLGIAALAAGVDSRLALGAFPHADRLLEAYLGGGRRDAIAKSLADDAAVLTNAVVEVPYWRRRGHLLHPELREKIEDIARLDKSFERFS